MKNLLFILTVFLLSVQSSLYAEQKVTVIDVKGHGISMSEAIQNALIEAVKQTKGVNIDSKRVFAKQIAKLSVSDDDGNSRDVAVSSLSQSQVQEATKGLVREYRVIDTQKLSPGEYEVELSVKMVEYKTPGHSAHKRRKIAIVPSYASGRSFQVLGSNKSARMVTQRLTQELVSAVTQTRKFSVLDRENNDAYNMEKNVILSRDAHKDEMMKLGNVLGADYLLVSNITDFKIYNDRRVSSLTGHASNNLKAYATVQYRVLAMATKQVKWSNTTTFEFKPRGNTAEQVLLHTLKKISDDLTYELIENIFPIKVIERSASGLVILNQSSSVGQVYDVYQLGKKLYDSYTKEFLGQDEILIGKIKVTKKLPKISYAKILEGKVKKGAICRKAKARAAKREVIPDEEIGTESGFSL